MPSFVVLTRSFQDGVFQCPTSQEPRNYKQLEAHGLELRRLGYSCASVPEHRDHYPSQYALEVWSKTGKMRHLAVRPLKLPQQSNLA
jgi:hypothetical protein